MQLIFLFLPFDEERSEGIDFYYPRYITEEEQKRCPGKYTYETLIKLKTYPSISPYIFYEKTNYKSR